MLPGHCAAPHPSPGQDPTLGPAAGLAPSTCLRSLIIPEVLKVVAVPGGHRVGGLMSTPGAQTPARAPGGGEHCGRKQEGGMDSGTHEGRDLVSTWATGASPSQAPVPAAVPSGSSCPCWAPTRRLRAFSPLRKDCCTAQAGYPGRLSPSTRETFFCREGRRRSLGQCPARSLRFCILFS